MGFMKILEDRKHEEQGAEKGIESPRVIPLMPLKDTVVYPLTLAPLAVGQERSLKLVDDISSGDKLIGLVAQKSSDIPKAGPGDTFMVGTVGRIHQLLKMPNGTLRLIVQGMERFRIVRFIQEEPYLTAEVEVIPERQEDTVEMEAMVRTMLELFQNLSNLSNYIPDELVTAAVNVEDPRQLAYFIAVNLRLNLEQRQELLEIDSTKEKIQRLISHMKKELEVLELGKKIQSQAEEQMNKLQREFYLREQLKAIHRELGEEEVGTEAEQLREKIEASAMPTEARREAERELARLEKLPPISPEYSVIRTYLDWLTELPWSKSTGHEIDIPEAQRILDEDHYDLEKVKERILEYLAVRKLKTERARGEAMGMKEPILCFVGPPGVGKTSLGQSIARAMGRRFVRMSLGGIRDEAEVRGHRRTYIGALPGRIIQAIRRAEANDPVFMLDEVDKIGADWRGDPSSALLEVLDPEQNKDFRDHYLDVPFDLSKVMFITTANTLDSIPPALRDRMETLTLLGYTEEEKVKIAEHFLVPKQRQANALAQDEVAFDEEALRVVVRDYTREAGVRNLEREIATICRKIAKDVAEGKYEMVQVTTDKVRAYLGRPHFFSEVAERIDRPGVATGLVWTPVGGDIVFVEATIMPGNKTLKLTGQMGEVMRESAEAALSYVRSKAKELGIDPNFFEKNDLHIHVPAAAVPKDGPSAGITLATALVSLLTGRIVRSDVAMTGEITLRGKVLPVGGIKEKVLGAHRAGIKTVILPRRNEQDLEDLPAELREELRFVPVENLDEVLSEALVPARVIERERAEVREPVATPLRQAASEKNGKDGDPLAA